MCDTLQIRDVRVTIAEMFRGVEGKRRRERDIEGVQWKGRDATMDEK